MALLREIAKTTQSQAEDSMRVSDAISELMQVTEENTTMAQQTAGISENLSDSAIGLENVLAHFRGNASNADSHPKDIGNVTALARSGSMP